MNKILLTGATGFVGRNLLRRLVDKGYNVRCIVRNKEKLGKIKNLNAKFVLGDITKKNSIKNSMHNIDVVFHLAVMVNVSECLKNPVKAFETNTFGTLNLLEEIREEALKARKEIFLIYLSSDRVYGNCKTNHVNEETCPCPLEPYSVSKLNSELLIKCYNTSYDNIPYIILRSANVYGYSQSKNFFIPSVISQAMNGKNKIKTGNLGYFRNFVYIDDLIDALILALEKKYKCKNQVFNVAESSVKMLDVSNLIKKFSANYLKRNINFSEDKQLARSRSIEFNKYVLDCSKIENIGWKPKTKFEHGLRKTFTDFLNKNG